MTTAAPATATDGSQRAVAAVREKKATQPAKRDVTTPRLGARRT